MGKKLTFTGILISSLLLGCDSTTETADSNESADLFAPARIRNSLAVDESRVAGVLFLDGRQFPMQRLDGGYQVSVDEIPTNTTVQLSVEYTETLPDGRELILSRSDLVTQNVGTSDLNIRIPENRFGFNFDIDNDGITNITEREAGTDPFVVEVSADRGVFVTFSIPPQIADPSIVLPFMIIADVPVGLQLERGVYRGSSTVPGIIDVVVDVRLQVTVDGVPVTIAQAIRLESAGAGALNVDIPPEQFNFQIDADGDGVTNYDEILQGTDPFIAN